MTGLSDILMLRIMIRVDVDVDDKYIRVRDVTRVSNSVPMCCEEKGNEYNPINPLIVHLRGSG